MAGAPRLRFRVVLQNEATEAGVGRADAGADELERVVVLGDGAQGLERLVLVGGHLLDGGIRGAGADVEHEALVFGRCQLGLGHDPHQRERQHHRDEGDHDGAEDHDHAPGVQHGAQHAVVEAGEALEVAVEDLHQAVVALVLHLEEVCAHHRRQGERDERGDRHCPGQREGELREQRAGESALEADRDVDGDQHHGDRDDGAGQFAGRIQRRLAGWLAKLHVAVDVLDHDDRIIHHQADGQHQCQQGQQVDGVAEGEHDEEGTHQR